MYKGSKRLASEYGEPWKAARDGLRVAVIYPNTYFVGMSNLGFQAVYHLLNQREDVTCERVFLPDREESEKAGARNRLFRSLESGRPLKSFDILAFSVSFELDYLHIVEILQGGNISPHRRERIYGQDPMIWIGGVGVSINPEPLGDLADLIFIGESEALLQEVLDVRIEFPVRNLEGFEAFCQKIRHLPGLYLPHAYTFHYDSKGRVTKIENQEGYPSRIKRRWVRDLDQVPTLSWIMTPHTELNDMFLVELDRGCGRHCRFCAAGYLYRPPRFRSIEGVMESVRKGLGQTDRIGLVGSAVSDYPWMVELVQEIRALDGKISVSSLRTDSVRPELMTALAQSGHKTLSLAPEGGSQRMREVINKGIDEQGILDACRMVFASHIPNLKLYFMVGLPYETEEDLEALVRLVLQIKEIQMECGRDQGRIGRITVSLNSFVPKPQTPFQWAPMNKKDALSKKIGYIKQNLRKKGNITVIHDLPKWSIIQGLMARGDRRIGTLLCSVIDKGGNWTQALKEWGDVARESAFRTRDKDEIFPWEIVDAGCRKEFLYEEYQRSSSGRFTKACPENLQCHRCGVCRETGEGIE